MKNLWIEVEVLDFDLEMIGFDLKVLNSETSTTKSKSYNRMTLDEFRVFVDALKNSSADIKLLAPNKVAGRSKFGRPAKLVEEEVFPNEEMMKREIAEEVAKSVKR